MCTLFKKLVSKKEKSEMAISLVDSAFSELYHPPPVLLTVFFFAVCSLILLEDCW